MIICVYMCLFSLIIHLFILFMCTFVSFIARAWAISIFNLIHTVLILTFRCSMWGSGVWRSIKDSGASKKSLKDSRRE